MKSKKATEKEPENQEGGTYYRRTNHQNGTLTAKKKETQHDIKGRMPAPNCYSQYKDLEEQSANANHQGKEPMAVADAMK